MMRTILAPGKRTPRTPPAYVPGIFTTEIYISVFNL